MAVVTVKMQNPYSSTSTFGPFIDGASSASQSDSTFDVINPSNGRVLFSVPIGSDRDVDQAVAAARRSFEKASWSDSPPSFKKAVLHKLADMIAAHATEFDALDAEEMGKPISEAFANAQVAASTVRFYAEAVDKLTGDVYSSDARSFAAQRLVPRGVVAAIVPWNFPTFNGALKAAPALAAGNSVVLKPSELASRSALRLAQLAVEAGLPPGVLNVIPGVGEVVGRGLGLHPDVDMVTFTGSTSVGKQLLQYAGQSNMKVTMAECGGKAPHIVFADAANLDEIADDIAQMIVRNQGQICSVGSRVLVEKSIEAPLIERLAARIKSVVVGDALDPKTTFGPLASAQQCKRVLDYISFGRSDGAVTVTGGKRILQESGGYFVEPTIFRGAAPDSRIAQEEIFGPVLSITAFEDEQEAIHIANGTVYGLIAYAWTTDLSRAMRLVKSIRSSIIVNAAAPTGEGPGDAFSSEPSGQSGLGAEGGLPGMESYMRRQLMWINHG